MLGLDDLFHLPQIDPLIEDIVKDRPGLILVAGHDPNPAALAALGNPLPSGRGAVFGILTRRLLTAYSSASATLIAETKDAVRLPSPLRRRVRLALVKPPVTYRDALSRALKQRPDMLVLDQWKAEVATQVLQVSRTGLRVVTQINCPFTGARVARYLLDPVGSEESLSCLTWIITVRRLRTLCEQCRKPAQLNPAQKAELANRFPDVSLDGTFFHAAGCAECKQTGRSGYATCFDVFHAAASPPTLFDQPSLVSLEEYVLRLAALGSLALEDLIQPEDDQLNRTHISLVASERALSEANQALTLKLAEIEAANRVLQQRTESLISLQEMATTLVSTTDLDHLASRICLFAHKLCGADRSVLYVLRPDGVAQILAVDGWDSSLVGLQLDGRQVFRSNPADSHDPGTDPTPLKGYPPGIPDRAPDVQGFELRAGLSVPLVAQNEIVGLLIVHSTHNNRFTPGQAALLHAFANHAAVAIQRTGLVESLRDRLSQLQTAQNELARRERLERELELARELQQKLIPRSFPKIPGYTFAARNEAARLVGGDFYDVFALDPNHFGLIIGDVSDKGMPAALFMALTRSLVFAEARRDLSPRNVLASVHRLLLELGESDMFVTAFYGVVDVTTRTLTFSRAGHEKPLLLRSGTVQSLGGQGTLLGLIDSDQVILSEERSVFEPGDILVLYTDGLTDALSAQGEPFGLERLRDFLTGHAANIDDLCAATFSNVMAHQFGTEQFDDMAMLAMQVD